MGSDPLLVLAASSPRRLSLALIVLGETVGTVKGMVFMLQGKITSCEHWVMALESRTIMIVSLIKEQSSNKKKNVFEDNVSDDSVFDL